MISAVNRCKHCTNLNLHFQVKFEPREESQEDGERELKDLRHGGDTVLAESHAQVLLDGGDEHDVTTEHGACWLQDGQEQVQRENLWP